MPAVRSFFALLRELTTTTVRVWWNTLPRILIVVMLGYLGHRIFAQLAALVIDISAWLSLGLLSMAFVVSLSAIVISLRIAGQELRIREAVPLAEDDPRDNSISHLLAITLLPFLGIYAAFDKVNDAANDLQIDYWVFYGLSFERPLLSQTNPSNPDNNGWLLFGLIAGLYVLRRLLDLLFDKTGFRPLGLLSALIEGFFLLILVLTGRQFVLDVGNWVDDRRFRVWLDYPSWGMQWLFAQVGVDIRAFLEGLGSFWNDTFWPAFTTTVAQPLLWLAVAALVYGTQVLSVADMWRKGQPITMQARHGQLRLGDRQRAVALQFQEALFGDLNDKYLPTFQSLRLVLGVGATFLGAFVVAYGGLQLIQAWLRRGIDATIGGHEITFWMAASDPIGLFFALLINPLQWCLLAAAFQMCLRIFHDSAVAPTPDQEATAT